MADQSAQVQVTPGAASKLETLSKGRPVVRLYVAGQLCCGYRYGLALDDGTRPGDTVSSEGDVLVVVAEEDREACSGAVVDYVQTADGEGFTVRTPGTAAGCTCGRS